MHAHTFPTHPVGTTHRKTLKTHYQRLMMFFVLVFLALQLIGAGSHTHAYTDHQSDCAACAVAHLPAGAPPPVAMVVPVALLVNLVPVVPQHVVRIVRTQYLQPPSHAPPAVIS
jgi:hypothetical protein